jgi:4-aminobutyrate aminotransferase
MSVTASKSVQKGHFLPLVGSVYNAHYPFSYRPFFGNENPEAEAQACLNFIRDYLFKMTVQPADVAAILVEPIQGEGGYVVPPKNWLPGLRKLCDEHGILLIADEVQSGIGRTGKMWACEYDDIEPDIITSAKGLASGMPLGAIIAKANVMTWPPGAHATTFGGNPVACAAALATLDLVENGLMQNSAQQGQLLMARLEELIKKSDRLGEVRGRGLMVGLEIVESKQTRNKDPKFRDLLVDKCFENGLLLLGCGENGIRFCPPLVVDAEDIETAVSIFEAVLSQCESAA